MRRALALLATALSTASAVRVSGLTFDEFYLRRHGQGPHIVAISPLPSPSQTPSPAPDTDSSNTPSSTTATAATLSARAPQASSTVYISQVPPDDPTVLVVPINATISEDGPGGYNGGTAALSIACACEHTLSRNDADLAVAKLATALGDSYFIPAGSAVLAISGKVVAYACNWNNIGFGIEKNFFSFAAGDVEGQCGTHVGGTFAIGGLDAGYVNWEKGVDFCVEAERFKSETC
jgi:hypothetical protein